MTTRRDFLKEVLAGITIVGFVPGALVSCGDSTSSDTNNNNNNPPQTFVVSVATLDAEGKALRSTLPTTPNPTPIMVVRKAGTTFVTLELICTHEGCSGSEISQSGQTLTCGCHGSQFNLSGQVIKGPAARNLDTYATTFDAAKNEVTIEF